MLLYAFFPSKLNTFKKINISGNPEYANEIQAISTAYFYFSEKEQKIRVCLLTNSTRIISERDTVTLGLL